MIFSVKKKLISVNLLQIYETFSKQTFSIQMLPAAVLPDDVIVVAQVKPLAVLSGVVNHADPGHKVHHLLPSSVVQIIPALVAPVPVDPVQSETAARGAPVRHVHSSDGTQCPGSLLQV